MNAARRTLQSTDILLAPELHVSSYTTVATALRLTVTARLSLEPPSGLGKPQANGLRQGEDRVR